MSATTDRSRISATPLEFSDHRSIRSVDPSAKYCGHTASRCCDQELELELVAVLVRIKIGATLINEHEQIIATDNYLFSTNFHQYLNDKHRTWEREWRCQQGGDRWFCSRRSRYPTSGLDLVVPLAPKVPT